MALSVSRLKKYRDIALLLIKYGSWDLLRNKNFEPALGLDDETELIEPGSGSPAEFARDLEALGPTFIKLGQMLSTRGDLLPPEYLESLARLQDRVDPFPATEVRRIVASELGEPLSKLFKTFSREPVAAASLAQVHRARMPDGRLVAVKVQRPDVQEQVTEDLEVLGSIAEFLDRHTDAGRKYDFHRTLEEFRRTLIAELDYRIEAQHMRLLAAKLAKFELILVPQPVDAYSTTRVLTMDYVRGKKIAELRSRNGVDGRELADQLFSAYLQQILVDGIFHADPHPGNVLITPEGRLALIDIGMVGRLSPPMQEEMLKLMLAVSEGEAGDAADLVVGLSEAREGFDEAAFRQQLTDLVTRYRDASVKQIPVGRVMIDLTRIAVENGLRVVPELTLLAKTLLNLDQVARLLNPDFDPNDALRRHSSPLIRQRLMSGLSPANLFTSLLETKEFVLALPERANRILDALSRSDLQIKVEMIDEGAVIDGLQKVANRITLGLVLAALILGAALLMQIDTPFKILGYPGLAILFFVAAAGGGLWLAFIILRSDRTPGPRVPTKRVS